MISMEGNNQATTPLIKIEQFDGPFHVLVEMLESQRLDITQVALSQVTEQYLKAINPPASEAGSHKSADPHVLADFLVVAAQLLYLKSKVLLPMLADDEAEDEASLEDQLKMYKQYYEASKVVEKMLKASNFSFAREKLAVDVEVLFNPPHSLTTDKMKSLFIKVVVGLEPIVRVPKQIKRQVISIRDKIKHVRDHIIAKMTSSFSELVKGSKDRTESIITFLALLELVKQQIVNVEQSEQYGEINIEKIAKS